MTKTPGRVWRIALAGLALCPALWCAGMDDEVSPRETLDRWIEAKQLLSRERQDWRLGRQLLDDRIDLIGREIAALTEKTEAARAGIGEADGKLAGMTAHNEELKAATAGLGDTVARLEARVLALLKRSPSPVRERVKPLSQRVPVHPDETEMGLSERFQNVVGILNEMNKFSGEITEASEVRDLPDGSRAEVTVLYLGLGQAYYCNEKSGVAGVGRPGEEGWLWEPRDDLIEAVAEVIAVFRNEQPAVYVGLPVEVR